jgi:hypothetical protein
LKFLLAQIFASSVSNLFGTIIGHPFDTVKVCLLLFFLE